MSFKQGPRMFVGPFDSSEKTEAFTRKLRDINPGFLFRGGRKSEPRRGIMAFGYASHEHLGIMSWGGYEDGDTLYSPQEFLGLIETSNSRDT